MEKGSVIDAQITLDEQFRRVFPGVRTDRDEFLELWMASDYGVQVFRQRGRPLFFPAYPAIEVDEYGRFITEEHY